MENYTIYCTKEQTKKALELGASLQEHPFEASIIKANERMFSNLVCINDRYYCLPTAEQMIGWLEEHEEIDEIAPMKKGDGWVYVVYMTGLHSDIECLKDTCYPSRKEATLVAIDAALDYIETRKKN